MWHAGDWRWASSGSRGCSPPKLRGIWGVRKLCHFFAGQLNSGHAGDLGAWVIGDGPAVAAKATAPQNFGEPGECRSVAGFFADMLNSDKNACFSQTSWHFLSLILSFLKTSASLMHMTTATAQAPLARTMTILAMGASTLLLLLSSLDSMEREPPRNLVAMARGAATRKSTP